MAGGTQGRSGGRQAGTAASVPSPNSGGGAGLWGGRRKNAQFGEESARNGAELLVTESPPRWWDLMRFGCGFFFVVLTPSPGSMAPTEGEEPKPFLPVGREAWASPFGSQILVFWLQKGFHHGF